MLTDFLKSFAIVTLATAALATPAMATDMSFTATKDGAVSIADLTPAGGVNTILLIDTTDADPADLTASNLFRGTVTEDMIVHIDETKLTVENGAIAIDVKSLADKDGKLTTDRRLELRVFGVESDGSASYANLNQALYTVKADVPEETKIYYNLSTQTGDDKGNLGAKQFYADSTRKLGDVTVRGDLMTTDDSTTILYHLANIGSSLTGELLQAADANNDGYVNLDDSTDILYYLANIDRSAVNGETTVAGKTASYIVEKNADGSDLIVDAQGKPVTE